MPADKGLRLAGRQGQPVADPSPAEILERIAQIQALWSHDDRLSRMGLRGGDPAIRPNGFAESPARGTVSTRPPSRREW